MSNDIIKMIEQGEMRKDVPEFHVGDTVEVRTKIVEGDKERIQPFAGVVIRRRGHGLSETFAVRRVVEGEGVERNFPLHSPFIVDIVVKRPGKVRRARLYYLRKRRGKAARIRAKEAGGAAAESEAEEEQPKEK
jgi:large subunit ribosomal protein L19